MTIWVVRKSLDGAPIGAPNRCAKRDRIVREPGLPTLEELFAIHLNDGETVDDRGGPGPWRIYRDGALAGHFEVIDPAGAEPS